LFLCFYLQSTIPQRRIAECSYSFTHFFTMTINRGEWPASRSGSFTPSERALDTHWIEGWVGSRAVTALSTYLCETKYCCYITFIIYSRRCYLQNGSKLVDKRIYLIRTKEFIARDINCNCIFKTNTSSFGRKR